MRSPGAQHSLWEAWGPEDEVWLAPGSELSDEPVEEAMELTAHRFSAPASKTHRLPTTGNLLLNRPYCSKYELEPKLLLQKRFLVLLSSALTITSLFHWGQHFCSDKARLHKPNDYYYQTYYDDSLPSKETDLTAQQSQYAQASTKDESQIDSGSHAGIDGAECVKHGQEDPFTSDSQESASALAAEGTALEGSSIADSLRAAAEAAVSQTGFTYDENTGLYFDHSTGFYYDSENQLYYDPSTGIYYYCDVESGRYQFHSRVDLQPYQTSSIKPSKDKKLKKRRKEPGFCTANDEKDLSSEDQNICSIEYINCSEEENSANMKKKARIDTAYRSSPLTLTVPVSGGTAASPGDDNSASSKDEKIRESESEPEEGEITDSQSENSYDEDSTSENKGSSEESEDEVEEEKIWPPCIRVIVVRSPVLQTGSLFIITAVNPATIGREKDMEHTLRIPEVGVSKFHAEIYFDHDLQSYVLVDQGSQNGTVVNGKQILQPKTKSDPYVLEHGDEVKIGETVLSFHIHPGSETCDGCEPGQVRAHLRLDKKGEPFAWSLYHWAQPPTFRITACGLSEITDSNKGRKMLEKMGWRKGEGLGKDGGGMKTPIQLQLRRTHAGLGTGKPSSVDDLHFLQNKSKTNWDKARERFAENFTETKPLKDSPGAMPWVKGTAE
ncbi:Angiogenic factor with G patch and FHA domains 1 [Cricetulus griseus]|uniref:Angiogenic factor with G patch and FHA domains 1 n=1 Tax=Cricetulus griseus TaxID=10029 RepID=G3H323_CRIGR|nr:Angiogenic factor with G patch and FHA domains 1 [Cricetulus griseus]